MSDKIDFLEEENKALKQRGGRTNFVGKNLAIRFGTLDNMVYTLEEQTDFFERSLYRTLSRACQKT